MLIEPIGLYCTVAHAEDNLNAHMWLWVCGMHRDLASLIKLTSKIFPFKTSFSYPGLTSAYQNCTSTVTAACAQLFKAVKIGTEA